MHTTFSVCRELRAAGSVLLLLLLMLLATIEHVKKALKLGQSGVHLEEADEC